MLADQMATALQEKLGSEFIVENSTIKRPFASNDTWQAKITHAGEVKFADTYINFNGIRDHLEAWADDAATQIRTSYMPIQGNNMNGDQLARRIDHALGLVREELFRAMTKHAGMHSAHEGHSVIREEVHELWAHVMADTGKTIDARKEALQIAAMGLRYALDVTGL